REGAVIPTSPDKLVTPCPLIISGFLINYSYGVSLGAVIDFFNRRRGFSLKVLITLVVLSSFVLVPLQTSVFADGTACQSSSPESGAYTVMVCITAPLENAVVSGK